MNHNEKPLKTKLSITLDPNVIAEMRILSDNDGRSLSQFINRVLVEYIRNLKETEKR